MIITTIISANSGEYCYTNQTKLIAPNPLKYAISHLQRA